MDDNNRKWLEGHANPWKEVVNMLHPEESDCLFREDMNESKWYVCEKDREIIKTFNKRCKRDDTDRIITNTPPEPWKGNPLEARVIVLSLNPGFVKEINETLAKLLQSNKCIRNELIEFRKKTLMLEEDSFFPKDDCSKPISIKDAEDMMQAWYWSKKFNTLLKQSELEESVFWKRVALIEYHGYSSATSGKSFPLREGTNTVLDSQNFLIEMIEHIANKPDNDVCFILLRAQTKWEELLRDIQNYESFHNKRITKNNKGRSQSITPENLGVDNFKKVMKILKGEKN